MHIHISVNNGGCGFQCLCTEYICKLSTFIGEEQPFALCLCVKLFFQTKFQNHKV